MTIIRCACGCGSRFVDRGNSARYASRDCETRGRLLIRRALAAYGWSDGEPLPTSVRIESIAGLRYVVLRRGRVLLACYRVRNDGKLKRLVRLPDGI